MQRKHPEQDLQRSVIVYLGMACPDVKVIHIPNQGYRRISEAAMLKRMGVVAGCPDLLLMWKPGRCGFIELKAPGEKKRLSAHQVGFLCDLQNMDIPNAVCDSLDDVRAKIREWGMPCREKN